MHAFQPETFAALSPAKAKAAALALFDSAMLEPAADWRGVAYALHSVVSRKRGAAAGPISDDIAMQDAADASEFAAWADYPATGKAANIARGRVTVTFADGWSKTVGMLAGRTAKGRKPWSIAHAVRFAVICYKIAAVRRATGDDGAIYFDKGGNASGQSITLDALICAPEIVSVISAESAETVAGDLVWNPEEANAFTLDQRAGAVTVSNAYGPHTLDASRAIYAARGDMLARLGLVYVASYALAKAAAERVTALLWPSEIVSRSAWDFHCFASVIEAEPAAYPWDADLVRDFTDSPGLAEMAGFTPDAADAPAMIEAEENPMLASIPAGDQDGPDVPAYDGDAMRAAMEIVGAYDDDAFARWLVPSTWSRRRITVEDALIAWPAEEEIADVPEPAPHASRSDSLPVISVDGQTNRWHVWDETEQRSRDIADVWPGAVVLIATSHRSRAKLPAGIAKVSHMPYPQAGVLADAETAKAYLDVKGIRITGPRRAVKALRFPAGEPQEADATVAAPIAPVEPPAPVQKPRYRFSHVSGAWEIVPPADTMPLAA
jgi:hypothetical protein